MAKKKNAKKPSVKVKDLRAKKNPKGGAYDAFLKFEGIKGESLDLKHKTGLTTGLKINPLDTSIKIK